MQELIKSNNQIGKSFFVVCDCDGCSILRFRLMNIVDTETNERHKDIYVELNANYPMNKKLVRFTNIIINESECIELIKILNGDSFSNHVHCCDGHCGMLLINYDNENECICISHFANIKKLTKNKYSWEIVVSNSQAEEIVENLKEFLLDN